MSMSSVGPVMHGGSGTGELNSYQALIQGSDTRPASLE